MAKGLLGDVNLSDGVQDVAVGIFLDSSKLCIDNATRKSDIG